MPNAARLGDSITGTTSGEHSGHEISCGATSITGSISGNCSSNVFINGRPAAFSGSITEENDSCCGTASGVVSGGSSSVFINGKKAARNGDAINPHNGTAEISSGSGDVLIG